MGVESIRPNLLSFLLSECQLSSAHAHSMPILRVKSRPVQSSPVGININIDIKYTTSPCGGIFITCFTYLLTYLSYLPRLGSQGLRTRIYVPKVYTLSTGWSINRELDKLINCWNSWNWSERTNEHINQSINLSLEKVNPIQFPIYLV